MLWAVRIVGFYIYALLYIYSKNVAQIIKFSYLSLDIIINRQKKKKS